MVIKDAKILAASKVILFQNLPVNTLTNKILWISYEDSQNSAVVWWFECYSYMIYFICDMMIKRVD